MIEGPTPDEVAEAAVDRDLAREEEVATRVAASLAAATARYRDAVAQLAEADDESAALAAVAAVEAARTEVGELALEGTEAEAAAAARLLLRYRGEHARRKRYHERALRTLARDLEVAERAIVPFLRAWAAANPPRRGRTVRLDGARLRFRAGREGLEVDREAAAELEDMLGAYEAAERGVIRHKMEVGRRALRGLLKDQPELLERLKHVRVTPAEDKFYVDEG